MTIKINLDAILVKRKMTLRDLAGLIGITEANLSKLKNAHIKAIRIQTLNLICKHLSCQPADLLEYVDEQ